jgi:asparagine N-glycosylation enzyme membrane subunit Stt3
MLKFQPVVIAVALAISSLLADPLPGFVHFGTSGLSVLICAFGLSKGGDIVSSHSQYQS